MFQLTKCDPDFISQLPNGFDENDKKTRDKCLYLKQLLADKRTAAQMPGVFLHMERLLDDGKLLHNFWRVGVNLVSVGKEVHSLKYDRYGTPTRDYEVQLHQSWFSRPEGGNQW